MLAGNTLYVVKQSKLGLPSLDNISQIFPNFVTFHNCIFVYLKFEKDTVRNRADPWLISSI